MNLPAASCGVSKGGISILIPLTLTLSRRGERESKVTLQRATGNYQVKKIMKRGADYAAPLFILYFGFISIDFSPEP
jgi:hypothetical protein